MISLLETERQPFGWAAVESKEATRRRYAYYLGYQEGLTPWDGLHLWNLKETLGPDLVAGTTVSEQTLDAAIF